MGYTHYWKRYRSHDENKWQQFTEDTKQLIHLIIKVPFFLENKILLSGGGGATQPVVNNNEVILNGKYPDACEDFVIRKNSHLPHQSIKKFFVGDAVDFSFCKTRWLPYDAVVVAVLCLYKHHFGDAVEISSDGDENDWSVGVNLVNKIFSYDLSYTEVTKTAEMNDYWISVLED